MIPFTGFARHSGYSAGRLGTVEGSYRWDRPGQPDASIVGAFHVALDSGRAAGSACHALPFDPFRLWKVSRLEGRSVELEIPEVGLMPVRLYSRPSGQERADPTVPGARVVSFWSTAAPVPILTRAEAAEILRVAIHDALLEGLHPELADFARAAAVAMAGFPERPGGPGELMSDFFGRRDDPIPAGSEVSS
jgi:hypothetical protein